MNLTNVRQKDKTYLLSSSCNLWHHGQLNNIELSIEAFYRPAFIWLRCCGCLWWWVLNTNWRFFSPSSINKLLYKFITLLSLCPYFHKHIAYLKFSYKRPKFYIDTSQSLDNLGFVKLPPVSKISATEKQPNYQVQRQPNNCRNINHC